MTTGSAVRRTVSFLIIYFCGTFPPREFDGKTAGKSIFGDNVVEAQAALWMLKNGYKDDVMVEYMVYGIAE